MSQEDGFAEVPAHICPACGHAGTLVREARDTPFEYRGHRTVIPAVRGVYCSACGEGFSDPAHAGDWQRLSDAMAAFTLQLNQ